VTVLVRAVQAAVAVDVLLVGLFALRREQARRQQRRRRREQRTIRRAQDKLELDRLQRRYRLGLDKPPAVNPPRSGQGTGPGSQPATALRDDPGPPC
jgi:hypothetical protein